MSNHNLNFGDVIAGLKQGKRYARAGWNGKGMWIAYTPGSSFLPEQARSGAALHLANSEYPERIVVNGHIDMRAADGTLVIGWLASQTDMMAEDWQEVA